LKQYNTFEARNALGKAVSIGRSYNARI